jgi:hypothetical protein
MFKPNNAPKMNFLMQKKKILLIVFNENYRIPKRVRKKKESNFF